VMPSAKYCCSRSSLRLMNGRTTIDSRGRERSSPQATATPRLRGRGEVASCPFTPLCLSRRHQWIRSYTRGRTLLSQAHLLSPCSMCRLSGSLPYIDRRDRIAAGALPLAPLDRLRHRLDQRPLCRMVERASRLHLRWAADPLCAVRGVFDRGITPGTDDAPVPLSRHIGQSRARADYSLLRGRGSALAPLRPGSAGDVQ
jgi:hypothetical protein